MRGNLVSVAIALLVIGGGAVGTAGAGPGKGAIPIWQPTTITESGSYVLTRDVSGSVDGANAVIDIAADDVTLDLDGFTLEGSGSDCLLSPPCHVVHVASRRNVTVRNGTIRGLGDYVTGIELEGAGLGEFVLRDLVVDSYEGILCGSTGESGPGLIESVRVNAVDYGIFLDTSNVRVVDNQVVTNFGIHVDTTAYGVVLKGNVVTQSGVTLGTGIAIHGSWCLLEGNLVLNYEYGLVFSSSANGNVYSRNVVRACPTHFVDDGTANTSTGDNLMPLPM